MDQAHIDRAAERLCAAWRDRAPVTLAPEDAPETLDDAYAVQARLVGLLGESPGYKVGYTNTAVQERFGVPGPIYGRLLADRVFPSHTRLAVPAGLDLVVEPEFAYQLRADLPPSEAPFDEARVAGALGGILPALEIVEPRLANWQTGGACLTVADNVLHSAWIIGEALEAWTPADVPSQDVVAYINDEEVSRGTGANVLGDPFLVMHWLANELAARGGGLHAGDYVTTGCCTAVLTPRRGDTVRADFGPFGSVSVALK